MFSMATIDSNISNQIYLKKILLKALQIDSVQNPGCLIPLNTQRLFVRN